jgi:hypothetical protein
MLRMILKIKRKRKWFAYIAWSGGRGGGKAEGISNRKRGGGDLCLSKRQGHIIRPRQKDRKLSTEACYRHAA